MIYVDYVRGQILLADISQLRSNTDALREDGVKQCKGAFKY